METTTTEVVKPLTDAERVEADALTNDFTAFLSFAELVQAPGGYRPSINIRKKGRKRLADLYDQEQAYRGDSRRAHRF